MANKLGKVGLVSNLPTTLTEGFEYTYDTGTLFVVYKDPTSDELTRGKVKCSKNTITTITISASDWVSSGSSYSVEKQLLLNGIILDSDDILVCYPSDSNVEAATLEIFECGINATVDTNTNKIIFTATMLPTTDMIYVIEINGAA